MIDRPLLDLNYVPPSSRKLIRPGESLFEYLNQLDRSTALYAFFRWNETINLLTHSELEHFLPRLLDKNHEQCDSAFFEIRLCRLLQQRGLDASLVLKQDHPDIVVNGIWHSSVYIECKIRNDRRTIEEKRDATYAFIYETGKHVKNQRIGLHIHKAEFPKQQPSAKRFAEWIECNSLIHGSKIRSGKRPDRIEWSDPVSGCQIECSIVLLDDTSSAAEDGLALSSEGYFTFVTPQIACEKILKQIRKQHKNIKCPVVPAIYWSSTHERPQRKHIQQAMNNFGSTFPCLLWAQNMLCMDADLDNSSLITISDNHPFKYSGRWNSHVW